MERRTAARARCLFHRIGPEVRRDVRVVTFLFLLAQVIVSAPSAGAEAAGKSDARPFAVEVAKPRVATRARPSAGVAVLELAMPSPVRGAGSETLLSEGFEQSFPGTNGWDLNWATEAPYRWGAETFRPFSGTRSGWCAGGSESGSFPDLKPQFDNYSDNMNSLMIWGPFNLAAARDAWVDFHYWHETEACCDDFFWGASIDDGLYHGYLVSGSSAGWQQERFDLTNVPTLGDLTGEAQVWVAFVFTSDFSIALEGAYVDDITIERVVPNTPPSVTHQAVASASAGVDLSISATITDTENPVSAALHYRRGGEVSYSSTAMTPNATTFTATVPALAVTARGLEYYIAASDGFATTFDPKGTPTLPPTSYGSKTLRPRNRTRNPQARSITLIASSPCRENWPMET
jgi:hypothetical protein